MRSRFPFHLRSYLGTFISACGNVNGVNLQWRSIKRVECKNCLKLIERGEVTKYFKPKESSQKDTIMGTVTPSSSI